jgi:hypothetical protein
MTTKKSATKESVQEILLNLDSQFVPFSEAVSKVAKALKDVKNAKSQWPLRSLGDLVQAISLFNSFAQLPELSEPAKALESCLLDSRANFNQEFARAMKDFATKAKIHFHFSEDSCQLGPFELKLDPDREKYRLCYGKSEVKKDLDLELNSILKTIYQQSKELFENRRDVRALANEFETAIKSSVGKSTGVLAGNLRAELPLLLKELQAVKGHAYSRPCFVIDTSVLIKSEENIDGLLGREFRLETAVIDNSMNDRKSVFIPDRLEKGWGEGKYYQAINLIYK